MRAVVCLTLEWAGRVIRVAQQHIDVRSTTTGRRYHYSGGLPVVDLEEDADPSGTGSAPRVTCDVLLPADVARVVEQGHDLAGSSVEVAVYSGDWDDREVYLLGYVESADYHPDTGLVSLVLTADDDDTALYPPPGCDISADTWPGVDDSAGGRTYPTILGAPGYRLIRGTWTSSAGSPAYRVYTLAGVHTILAAGHHLPLLRSTGGTVTLRDETAGRADTCSMAAGGLDPYAYDSQGQPVTTLTVANVAGQAQNVWDVYGDGDTLTVSWSGASGVADDDGRPVSTGGRALWYALQRSSLPVDWGRAATAVHALRAWEIAGYWDQRQSPIAWVRAALLPILPASLAYGPSGIYPVVWRWWATPGEAVAHLEDGRGCAWVAGPERVEADRYSSSTVRFALSSEGSSAGVQTASTLSTPRASRTLAASGGDARTGQDLAARRVYLRIPRETEMESDVIQDAGTAGLVARGSLRLGDLTRRVVVRVPSTLSLDPGSVVLYSSSRLSISRRLAWVLHRRRRGPAADVTLLLRPPMVYP